MKKVSSLILIIITALSLVACGIDSNPLDSLNPEQVTIDFENEKDFEAALNADFDVIRKVVTFTVDKIAPDSAFGFNLQTGEHLNFCSEEPQDVNEGDTVTVRVIEVDTFLVSYIISYEMISDSAILSTQSEDNKIKVSDSGVASIILNESNSSIYSVGDVGYGSFDFKGNIEYSDEYEAFNISANDFILVSSNPEVVELSPYPFQDKLTDYRVYFFIHTNGAGTSTLHIETKDGVVVSNDLIIMVED